MIIFLRKMGYWVFSMAYVCWEIWGLWIFRSYLDFCRGTISDRHSRKRSRTRINGWSNRRILCSLYKWAVVADSLVAASYLWRILPFRYSRFSICCHHFHLSFLVMGVELRCQDQVLGSGVRVDNDWLYNIPYVLVGIDVWVRCYG